MYGAVTTLAAIITPTCVVGYRAVTTLAAITTHLLVCYCCCVLRLARNDEQTMINEMTTLWPIKCRIAACTRLTTSLSERSRESYVRVQVPCL